MVGPQHKPLPATITCRQWPRKALQSTETRLRTWKLSGVKAEEFKARLTAFELEDREEVRGREEEWRCLKAACTETAEEICGRTICGNREYQELVVERSGSGCHQEEEMGKGKDRAAYGGIPGDKQRRNESRCSGKTQGGRKLYKLLEEDSAADTKKLYQIAKQKQKAKEHTLQESFLRDTNNNLLTSSEEVKNRWIGYFRKFLNEENPIERELPQAEPSRGEEDGPILEEMRCAQKNEVRQNRRSR